MPTPLRFKANAPTPAQDAQKIKLKRKRCLNCNALFDLTKPNRKFCGTNCKNEFARFGSAFGPLRTHIETMMTKHTKEVRAEVVKVAKDLQEAVTRIEAIEKFLESCEAEPAPPGEPVGSAYARPTKTRMWR